MKRCIAPAALAVCCALILSGCMTVPDPSDIPADSTVVELSQKGQSALDSNNYKAAEVYYQTILDRYGSDASARIAAEFEIAHMRIKKQKWEDAQVRLEAIIAAYETTGGTSLPPEYLVLARNDLARIPQDKLKQKPADETEPAAQADDGSAAQANADATPADGNTAQ